MSRDALAHGATSPDRIGTRPDAFERLQPRELVVRFAFGAAISALAGLVGLLAGRTVGGVLLAFPAILPAALTLVESKEGTSKAVSETRGAVLGALAMVAFAGTVVALVARTPGVLALFIASLAWTAVAIGLYIVGTHVRWLIVKPHRR